MNQVGDKLTRVKIKSKDDSKNKSDASVSSAILAAPTRSGGPARFPEYLSGLRTSLEDRALREGAVARLGQREACAAVPSTLISQPKP